MTLDEIVTEFEKLLAEARGYPLDAHGYPGKEVADSWYARERDSNLWARTLVERAAPARFEAIPWGPSVLSHFPGENWQHRVRHLERLIGSLRIVRDEQQLLGDAPPRSRPATRPPKSSSWLSRHGWQAVGTLIGLVGLILTAIGLVAGGSF